MPFKSEAQKGWMYANKPRLAKKWQKETPKGKDLPEKIAALILAKLAAEEDTQSTPSPSTPVPSTPNTPLPDPGELQRKQDLHDQQMRFNEDKHELDLEKLHLQLQQAQQDHQLKQEQALAKQEEAAPQMDPQQQQAQQQQQYQQNIMAKAAAMYTDELEPVDLGSPLPAMGVGGVLGGATSHFIAPSEATQYYRDLAGKITPEQIRQSIAASKVRGNKMPKEMMEAVSDITGAGNKVKFKAPAHVRSRYFKNRALQSNAKRLFKGTGLGLLAGLAAYGAMKD